MQINEKMEAQLRDPKIGGAPMTLAMWAEALAAIAEKFKAMASRIEQLEREAAELRERGIRFCGVHQRALSYRTGDVVTHGGSMWAAVRATDEEPGQSKDWQLCVKHGRDAR